VNTTAEVKAESDYCCTSGNAIEIVNSIPPEQEILFLPDMFLGNHVRRMTGRTNMHVWLGECHVHAGIDPEHISLQREAHPGAEFLVHPECGCSTSILEAMSAGDVDVENVQILSTEGMIRRPAISDADEYIVATEVGILHRLRRENPTKSFFPANERAVCAYMKVTTLPKVLRSLERMEHRITVEPEIRERAKRAIERMVAIGGQTPLSPAPEKAEDPGE
jgi:quinolinate synthase